MQNTIFENKCRALECRGFQGFTLGSLGRYGAIYFQPVDYSLHAQVHTSSFRNCVSNYIQNNVARQLKLCFDSGAIS